MKVHFHQLEKYQFFFRFSILVARRVYREIGNFILKKNNYGKLQKSGKIYVPKLYKIFQTFLAIMIF